MTERDWRLLRGFLWLWLGIGLGIAIGTACPRVQAQSPEVAAALDAASVRYDLPAGWLRGVSWCESRYQPWVVSRGGHMGLLQFSQSTWQWMSVQAGWAGASPFDPWAAADVAAWGLRNGFARLWSCA